jgi:glycosyltransferase involved in cell wall biosynthesis
MLIDKKVFFFTDNLSSSFIYNEVIRFSEKFKDVKVYLLDTAGVPVLPVNVSCESFQFEEYSSKNILKKYFFSIFSLVIHELIRYPKYLIHLKLFLGVISELMRCFYLFEQLNIKQEFSKKDSLNITFWFNSWATVLSIAKKYGVIEDYYSRVHGSDLYEYRVPVINKLPFRDFQLAMVKNVFSVSNTGSLYLKNKYPKYANKISVNYLGTIGHEVKMLERNEVFTIVSCSLINKIKRVYLIPEVLKYLVFPIHWIHIGEELSSDYTIKEFHKNISQLKASNNNIRMEFKGFVSNEDVFKFYQSQKVDLFISLSESEGLPVSMMEAISFGIPVLATDVGGCSEIVNSKTGILIEKEFDPRVVGQLISEFKYSKVDLENRKNEITQFWSEKFNAIKNHNELISSILN